jgi:hypothetical protein
METAMNSNNSNLQGQEDMYALVEGYDQSSQAHRDFCAAQGLP